jgi:hypothetical protein
MSHEGLLLRGGLLVALAREFPASAWLGRSRR